MERNVGQDKTKKEVMEYIIKNATLVNEGKTTLASVVINGDKIAQIVPGKDAIIDHIPVF